MNIVTQKNIADVKEVELTELDCKEAIASWLRTEHGMQVGRKDIDFIADYDQEWNETKLTGAKIVSYNFSPVETTSPLGKKMTCSDEIKKV